LTLIPTCTYSTEWLGIRPSTIVAHMSTFQIIPIRTGVVAIERDEKFASISVQKFPTQLGARKWVLERVDASVGAEQAALREQMLRSRQAASLH